MMTEIKEEIRYCIKCEKEELCDVTYFLKEITAVERGCWAGWAPSLYYLVGEIVCKKCKHVRFVKSENDIKIKNF